jgi:hypothetical protein
MCLRALASPRCGGGGPFLLAPQRDAVPRLGLPVAAPQQQDARPAAHPTCSSACAVGAPALQPADSSGLRPPRSPPCCRFSSVQVAVSFAHIVKSAEPVFSVILSWPLLGIVYPW